MNVLIGIDPGKVTGIAVCINGKLTDVRDTDFWGCIDFIVNMPKSTVIVELPNSKHVWHSGPKAKGAIQRNAVDVGSVIREAELIVEWLKKNQRVYVTMHPQGKVNAEYFKRVTGWTGRTNQHQRDAAMLVFRVK